jgi:hypothetical protein
MTNLRPISHTPRNYTTARASAADRLLEIAEEIKVTDPATAAILIPLAEALRRRSSPPASSERERGRKTGEQDAEHGRPKLSEKMLRAAFHGREFVDGYHQGHDAVTTKRRALDSAR